MIKRANQDKYEMSLISCSKLVLYGEDNPFKPFPPSTVFKGFLVRSTALINFNSRLEHTEVMCLHSLIKIIIPMKVLYINVSLFYVMLK